MDLWREFEMSARIGDMWQELGISGGTAIIVLIALYFVLYHILFVTYILPYWDIKYNNYKKNWGNIPLLIKQISFYLFLIHLAFYFFLSHYMPLLSHF